MKAFWFKHGLHHSKSQTLHGTGWHVCVFFWVECNLGDSWCSVQACSKSMSTYMCLWLFMCFYCICPRVFRYQKKLWNWVWSLRMPFFTSIHGGKQGLPVLHTRRVPGFTDPRPCTRPIPGSSMTLGTRPCAPKSTFCTPGRQRMRERGIYND